MKSIEQFLFNLTGDDLKTNLIRFGLIFFSVELIRVYKKRKELKILSLGVEKIMEKLHQEYIDMQNQKDQLQEQLIECQNREDDSPEESEKNNSSKKSEENQESPIFSKMMREIFGPSQESPERAEDMSILKLLVRSIFGPNLQDLDGPAMREARKIYREIQKKEKNIWLKELSKALILYIVFDIFGFFNTLTEYSVQLVDFIISII